MNHIHEKQDTAALWVQYNDLIVPVFGRDFQLDG